MNTTQLLQLVIIPLVTILVGYVVAYIKKKTTEIETSTANVKLNRYISIAEDAVLKSVDTVSQTYVSSIKGTDNWNADAQAKAFQTAKDMSLAIMGTAAQEALKQAYGDADAWIQATIEQYVYHMK